MCRTCPSGAPRGLRLCSIDGSLARGAPELQDSIHPPSRIDPSYGRIAIRPCAYRCQICEWRESITFRKARREPRPPRGTNSRGCVSFVATRFEATGEFVEFGQRLQRCHAFRMQARQFADGGAFFIGEQAHLLLRYNGASCASAGAAFERIE